MSRIGKIPGAIADGVDVTIDGRTETDTGRGHQLPDSGGQDMRRRVPEHVQGLCVTGSENADGHIRFDGMHEIHDLACDLGSQGRLR